MNRNQDLRSELPLAPHLFHILLALLERDLHGYGILKEIRRRTGGELTLGTSTLYAALQRLVRAGYLEESPNPGDEDSQGPPRKVFRITEAGRALAREEGRRVQRLSRIVADSPLSDALGALGGGDGS